MLRTRAKQLDQEIAEVLTRRQKSRSAHSIRRSSKEQFVDLLMQSTDESRAIARDLLLENDVIKTGRVESVKPLSFSGLSGPIHLITMNVGGDHIHYWLSNFSVGYDVPSVGDSVDFMTTKGYPPSGRWIPAPTGRVFQTQKASEEKEAAPKEQLHKYGGFKGDFHESIIRKWIAKWWR